MEKEKDAVDGGVLQKGERKVGDAGEIGLRVLAKSSAIISAGCPLYTSARNEYART